MISVDFRDRGKSYVLDQGLKSIFQQNLTPTNFVLPTFQSTLRWSQRLQRLLHGVSPNSPSERNVPMIQCLAEKRADVNYRITVTRQIVRPPRKRIPALIVALIQKAIMLSLFKITPPKPWFGIGPDWTQFFFLPKCQFTYCKSITIHAAKGLNDLGYYETQTLWLWLSSPGINRGKGKYTIHGRFTEKSTMNVGCHFDYRNGFWGW